MSDTQQATRAPPVKPHKWVDYGADFWCSPYRARHKQHFKCKHGGCRPDGMYADEARNHDSDCPLMVQIKQEKAERAAKVRAAFAAHDWTTSDPLAMELAAERLGVKV